MQPAVTAPHPLDAALAALEDAVRAPTAALVASGSGRSALQQRLAEDVAGHRARVRDLEAPLLVVVGGVTGAGKSTIVNTLLGRALVATGVLRPTTFAPTLVADPGDLDWFTGDRVLGHLSRAESSAEVGAARLPGQPVGDSRSSRLLGDLALGGRGDAGVLRLVRDPSLPAGLALVDAPDIDSVSDANRDLADALLDAADLWLWCTTAGKYADEESMRYLRRAHERDTALVVALTQVRDGDVAEILDDFRGKLAAEGLGAVEILVVGMAEVRDGQLPAGAVTELRGWLETLSRPDVRRARRRQTLAGALAAIPADVERLVDELEAERRAVDLLADDADAASVRARRDFAEALEEGLPLHREVLDRWNRFVGTGRFLRIAEQASGQARSWVRSLTANSARAEEQRLERDVRIEVGGTITDLVVQLADLAAAETVDAWRRVPGGRAVADRNPELSRADAALAERADAEVRAWQDTVVRLVATRGAERKVGARWVSTAVNAVATGAIVVTLAQTGGLTGVEAGIATGAAAANQTLLVKLLGAHNLRWLVGRAREDLRIRFDRLAEQERSRFDAVLAGSAPELEHVDALRTAAAAVSAPATALDAGGGPE